MGTVIKRVAPRWFRENPEVYRTKRLWVNIASTIAFWLFPESVERPLRTAPRESTRRAYQDTFLLQLLTHFSPLFFLAHAAMGLVFCTCVHGVCALAIFFRFHRILDCFVHIAPLLFVVIVSRHTLMLAHC